MDPLGMLCGLVLFACLWVAGPILLIGGGAGTLFARRGEDGPALAIPIIMLALGVAWTVSITHLRYFASSPTNVPALTSM